MLIIRSLHCHYSYSPLQIFSVILVTGGVILSTLSTSTSTSTSTSSPAPPSSYFFGISLLLLALLLSSIMGIWQELTFAKYGKDNWQESLFYSHFFSLPLLLLRRSDLHHEWKLALSSPPRIVLGTTTIPSMLPLLALNVITQLACINGVNRLTARISSVGVTLVLVVRKAVSLAISVLVVGSSQSGDMTLLTIGAAAVGLGTVGYAWASSGGRSDKTKIHHDKTPAGVQHRNITTPTARSTALVAANGTARKRAA